MTMMVVVMPLGYGDMALIGKGISDDGLGREFIADNALFGNVLRTGIVPRAEVETATIHS